MNKLMNIAHTYNSSELLKKILEELDMDLDIETVQPNSNTIDAMIEVDGNLILIETKTEITPYQIAAIEKQKAKIKEEGFIVFGRYITPKAKELLKEKRINFFDEGGNISFKWHNLNIRVEGKPTTSLSTKYNSRAFTKTGGIVVFQFLMNPNLVNQPQRTIADYAGVSLGTVPKVLEGLKQEGFLIKLDNKNYQLINYLELLQKWTEVLKNKILPAYLIGRYQTLINNPKAMLELKNIGEHSQWGGEPAAALITNYLHPEEYTIFTSNKSELVRSLKLKPNRSGDITVFKKFWNQSINSENIVHPILVYAQLMASGNSRNIELATKIMNEYIQPNL